MRMISEILGFLGIFLNIIIYQQKDRKKLLICKLFSDFAWSFHYGVAGNYSGAAVGAIGIAREGTFLTIEGRKKDRRPFLVLFFICACISAILTWKGWFSFLPATASLLSVISFWQLRPKISRLLAIPISLCMLTYDIQVTSVAGICNEILTLISTAIGIWRHDISENRVSKG